MELMRNKATKATVPKRKIFEFKKRIAYPWGYAAYKSDLVVTNEK